MQEISGEDGNTDETTSKPVILSETKERWLQEGIIHFNAKRYDESLHACDQAIQLDPYCSRAHYGKGLTLHKLERYEEALSAYEWAIQLNPGNIKAYNGKGNVLCEINCDKQGLAAYEEAIRLDPDYAISYYFSGNVLLKLQHYKEALAAYEHAIHLNPNSADSHCKRGSVLLDLHQYEDALAAFNRAILLAPENLTAYREKALTLDYFMSRPEDAEAVYDEFLQGVELRKLSCADAHPFSLLEESNLTGAKVSKALPYLEAKAKGDKSME